LAHLIAYRRARSGGRGATSIAVSRIWGSEMTVDLAADQRVIEKLVELNHVYDEFQDFSGIHFTGLVDLRGCRFNRGFSFDGATFSGRARFENVTVPGQRGNSASFVGTRFEDVARFNQASLYLANFKDTVFGDFVEFRGTRFYGSAQFGNTAFAQASSFSEAVFQGVGHFSGVTFPRQVDFREASFRTRRSHARFMKTTFLGPALFDQAQFAGHSEFKQAKFYGGASFMKAIFGFASPGNADDEDSADPDRDDVLDADLRISFEGAEFRPDQRGRIVAFDEARFGDLNFRRHANFDEAKFLRDTPTGERLQSPTSSFREIKCNGAMSLRRAQFAGAIDVDFALGRFEEDLDISEAHLGRNVIFERCQFKQSLSVAGTRFLGYPDFRNASFRHYPNLFEASLPTRLTSYPRKDRQLIAARIGSLRRIAARTHDELTDLTLLVHELKLKGGVTSRLYGLVSNYGQSWLRPAIWLLLLSLTVFPVIQLAIGGRLPLSADEWRQIAAGKQLACVGGEGNIFAAAVEISVKNAMIVGSDNETRSKRVLECLGAVVPPGPQTVAGTLLEALQAVLTVVLAFFIGGAVRRRLQLR
jgi:uncharacterized protein YjbI with pentapeptide repeats